jgi:hypothetical protein
MSETVSKPKGSGWAEFAVVMFLLAAALNIIGGIALLAAKDRFDENAVLWHNLQGIAIFWLVLGALQLVSGLLIHRRSGSGRILGVFVALISACIWFFALDVKPVWALVMIGLSIMIMYTLTVSAAAFKTGAPTDFDERMTNIPTKM